MKDIVVYSERENQLYEDIRAIIEEARANAIRSVDFNRVLMYWKTGHRVFEEEQHGADRADYGAYLIERLAGRLVPGIWWRINCWECPTSGKRTGWAVQPISSSQTSPGRKRHSPIGIIWTRISAAVRMESI